MAGNTTLEAFVALRKESVDRKAHAFAHLNDAFGSLSARRAWIEKPTSAKTSTTAPVALRKESVDRKGDENDLIRRGDASLSARRAWIEKPPQRHQGTDLHRRSLSARRAWIEKCYMIQRL